MSAVEVRVQARGGLLRILGLAFGLATVIGGTVGVGILRAPGVISAHLDNAVLILLVWAVAGAFALMATNTYAELATSLPKAGGPYVYIGRAFGNFFGFVWGWVDFTSSCLSLAYIGVAGAEFVGTSIPALAGHANLLGAAAIFLFATLNSFGLRTGSAVQSLLTLLKLLLLIGLILAAFAHSGPAVHQLSPTGHASGLLAMIVACIVSFQIALETYTGYNGACYFAEEFADPGRTLPRSMFGGVLVIIALYLLINIALLHLLSPAAMGASKLPIADALSVSYGRFAYVAVSLIATASALAIMHTSMLYIPRILYGLSRDGLFACVGMAVTQRGTPLFSLWTAAAMGIGLSALGGFERLFAIAATLSLLGDVLCASALFVLRHREPNLPRPYRAFGFPWVPGFVLIVGVALLVSYIVLNPSPSLAALLLIALSMPLFLAIRRAPDEPRSQAIERPLKFPE